MNELELHTALQRLFNILFELHESLYIKDEDTAITIAMLDHDTCVREQLTMYANEMKEYIAYGTEHGIPMCANYIRMCELFSASH